MPHVLKRECVKKSNDERRLKIQHHDGVCAFRSKPVHERACYVEKRAKERKKKIPDKSKSPCSG